MTVDLNPNAEAFKRKEDMWAALMAEDHARAAELASAQLQDHFAFDAVHVAGLALAKMGHEEAFDWCCMSIALSKASEDWYKNCAITFKEKQDYGHSLIFLKNGMEAHPDSRMLAYEMGVTLAQAQQFEAAETALRHVMTKWPDYTHAKLTLGFVLHMQCRYDEAIALYEESEPAAEGLHHEEVVNNWACVMIERGQQREALDLLNRLCRDPERKATEYNKSFIYLGLGWWPMAWHSYRLRMEVQRQGDQGLPVVDQPIAQTLADIKGKHLFMFHEQGLGDSLMFLRYARLLRPHCQSLTIGVPGSLARLAGRLDMAPDYRVISGQNLEEDKMILQNAHYALPMLDAPALLEQRTDNIPGEPYFLPVPEALVYKRSIATKCRTGRPRIGLVWAGAGRPDNIRAHSIDKRRSVPFELMEPILQYHDRADLVSLQMPDHHVDDARLIQPVETDWDVLDTCAVIAQLDLVICIDSAVAHMAGAFQKPVWMLSRLDQCWRWFWDRRETTDWYPAMSIFQQKTAGDWPEVIDRVVTRLNDRLR